MMRSFMVLLWFLAGVVSAAGCSQDSTGSTSSSGTPLGDGFAGTVALDANTLLVSFSRKLDRGSVGSGAFEIWDRTLVPAVRLDVTGASASGDAEVTVSTGTQAPGQPYTLTMRGLKDASGNTLDGTLNFVGGGSAVLAPVTFRITDEERLRAWGDLRLQLTVDPEDHGFSERLRDYAFTPAGAGLTLQVQVSVDARRTLTRLDDGDTAVDRRAYAARVMTVQGLPAGPLVPFVVVSADAVTVDLALLQPPTPVQPNTGFEPPTDPAPGDGRKRIRIIVDDRASRELTAPQVRCAFDSSGAFDVSFPQTLTLQPLGDPHLFAVEADVRVDANRTLDGMDESTLPYIVTLAEAGTDYDAINTSIIAPDETAEAVVLPLGDRTMTPVTFRIAAGDAYLTADGSQRGLFAGDAVFLTGEWQRAADALGRNAGDSFSGGEQLTMEMKPDPAGAGLWFKTLWLPPGRPYGWKVVRCQSGVGCGPLNQRVNSSGRAFATVMKNLATQNVDAFASPAVAIVDPGNAQAVAVGAGTADYRNADVYVGSGMGGEGDVGNAPNANILFKQEVPDLAVVVDAQPLVTPVYVVGTWRDVNLPVRPAEILAGSSTVALTPYDYDEGFIGRYPPQRSVP